MNLNVYRLESQSEFLKLWRMPSFSLPSILFPVFFYLLFGIAMGGSRAAGSTTIATYLMASYGCFGLLGTCMFGFGASLAIEREQGWLTLKRTTPMPPSSLFVAKTVMAMLFGLIILLLLVACGILSGAVHLTADQWVRFFAISLFSVFPFSVIGLCLGFAVGGKAAPAIANLIYLPLSFASGLWFPIEMMPSIFKKLAPALPPFHLNQLLLGSFGAGDGKTLQHLLFLMVFTVLGYGLVSILYRRSQAN